MSLKKISLRARVGYQAALGALFLGYHDLVMADDLTGSASRLQSGLTAVKGVLPVVAQILGLGLMIGGGMAAYKHFKSQGRDGNLTAGIAGAVIGALFFFLGSFLKFTAASIGLTATAAPF